jgi:hypothetical protein
MVWNDNFGTPGEVIYTREDVMVEQGSDINGFYTYTLPDGVPVNDVFYVGWRQRSETFLNAGFDINTPHNGRQFYWLNGSWNQSQVSGSVMIRPVVGDPLKITRVDDIVPDEKPGFRIWPNPASAYINIDRGDLPAHVNVTISITDLQGREQINVPLSDRIDISKLPAGLYIVTPRINGSAAGHYRLIKSR